jgi:FOG: TPR repeat, SEL1 subfamily
MITFSRKSYNIVSFALLMACSFSVVKASQGQRCSLEQEDMKDETRGIETSNTLETEDLAKQSSLSSWEALYQKAIHFPEVIKHNAALQDQLLTSYFQGHHFQNPSFFSTIIPNLKDRASSDAKALWLLLNSELQTLGHISNDAAALVKTFENRDDPESLLALSHCYNEGWGVNQDQEKGITLWKKLAEQGDAVAQINLGFAYYSGEGVECNSEKGFYWHRRAAEQGHPVAQLHLGDTYSLGFNVERNLKEAACWHRRAAEQGVAEAQINLGFAYFHGYGVEHNLKAAARWYHRAAEQGVAEAQVHLGDAYHAGLGVEQDQKAAFWYNLLASKAAPDGGSAFSGIKAIYRPTLTRSTLAEEAEYIYNLEKSPLTLFEDPSQPSDLSTRLARLNCTFPWNASDGQEAVGPAMFSSSQREKLSELYNDSDAIRKLLEETLPQDLSRHGFLITNLHFGENLQSPATGSPYMQAFTLSGQEYLCLGEQNVRAAQYIFALFVKTETMIESIVESLNICLETLTAIDENSEISLKEQKAYYQKTIATLGELQEFVEQSKRFVDDMLITSAPYRNKRFEEEYGHLFND